MRGGKYALVWSEGAGSKYRDNRLRIGNEPTRDVIIESALDKPDGREPVLHSGARAASGQTLKRCTRRLFRLCSRLDLGRGHKPRAQSLMNIISRLKRIVPAPFRPPLRRCLHSIWPRSRYAHRVQQELETYNAIENVHDLPAIAHYWSEKYVAPLFRPFGFANSIEFFRSYVARICGERPAETVAILSVGAGNCASEINIAEWLRETGIENYRFECVDINPALLKRGASLAEAKGLARYFTFSSFDLNAWRPSGQYHLILAIQSLHHFVDLEILFEKIHELLHPDGYFLADDMIGRNGHQRWPEALKLVNELWGELPDTYKFNHLLKRHEKEYENWDCSKEGFEGIRAQDILPLLVERFTFELFIAFSNVIDIFVDRCFGPNFDPSKEWDRAFIDLVQALDAAQIESGALKPTHMLAAMTKSSVERTKMYKHLSPEFCIRRPDPHVRLRDVTIGSCERPGGYCSSSSRYCFSIGELRSRSSFPSCGSGSL